MKLAVIGTGIAGLTVAHYARRAGHTVTCFEASDRPGGHVNTLDLDLGGERIAVDSGFIVFNRRNYPLFDRLLGELDIHSIPTRMSFSFHDQDSGAYYAGRGLGGLFADPGLRWRRDHWRMVSEIGRFNRVASRALIDGVDPTQATETFLDDQGFSQGFRQRYLWPMCAAIWSSPAQSIGMMPLRWLLQFFTNHGMFCGREAPAWRTIPGGARRYVRALVADFGPDLQLACPVRAVRRTADGGVDVHHVRGTTSVDRVVVATHAPQALTLLDGPSQVEQEVLSAVATHPNTAVVHTDPSLLPPRRRAWACWNYHAGRASRDAGAAPVSVTYHMNQLQRFRTSTDVFVTLGPVADAINPATILQTIDYQHPAFDLAAVRAQGRRSEVSGVDRIHYAGAWWGYGFHEDGCRSGHAVLAELGIAA